VNLESSLGPLIVKGAYLREGGAGNIPGLGAGDQEQNFRWKKEIGCYDQREEGGGRTRGKDCQNCFIRPRTSAGGMGGEENTKRSLVVKRKMIERSCDEGGNRAKNK